MHKAARSLKIYLENLRFMARHDVKNICKKFTLLGQKVFEKRIKKLYFLPLNP